MVDGTTDLIAVEETMRIAVFHNLPSGGAKRALYGLMKGLSTMGHQVDVFVPSTAEEQWLSLQDFAGRLTVEPVRKTAQGLLRSAIFYVLPVRAYAISLGDLETAHRKLAVAIGDKQYDVTLVEQDRYTFSPFILKYLTTPHVYYCQQPARVGEIILQAVECQLQSGIGLRKVAKRVWQAYRSRKVSAIDRSNATRAKYIVTNSFFSRENILRTYGINSFVCYLGVDNQTFRPLMIEKEDFVISVGQMVPSKGYDFVVRALAHIPTKVRPKLLIVTNGGSHTWKSYIQQIADRLGVELSVKTMISDNELVDLYNRARLFVYAPYLEPFGLAPLEAMACGTPVVAVKEGGVRESVVDGETGLLTERDEQTFAAAVMEVFPNIQRINRMGEACVDTVRSFWTLEHATRRLMTHLDRARLSQITYCRNTITNHNATNES